MQKSLEAISKQVKDKTVIGNGQHGFTKSKSCLTKPIDYCDKVTSAAGKGRAVDTAYVSKGFENFLQSLS